MTNSVSFAASTTGGGGGTNAAAPPAPANAAGSGTTAATTSATTTTTAPEAPPATWENLFGLDTLAPHSVAKGFLAEYNDATWEEVMAPFDMTYHTDGKIVKRALATAPVAKCVLAVNDAGRVQLVYGLRLCHAVQGQGERILGLGGERTLIAGVERQPDLLTLAGNLDGQHAHFGSVAVRAPPMNAAIAALDADGNKLLVDPLAADQNDASVNPEVPARRALTDRSKPLSRSTSLDSSPPHTITPF